MIDANAGFTRAATIAFCVLTALCEGIDLQAAGVAAAGIGAEFKPSADQMGTFFSASTFGLFFGAMLGGRLADRVGRKWVLVTSVALFGLFSLLTSFAWDIDSLTWMRALTGLGLGGALPMLLALVTEVGPLDSQGASAAMVYAATPFGGAAVSLLMLLMSASQWRTIFMVGGVVPLLVAPLMAIGLPESQAFRRMHEMAEAGPEAAAPMPRAGSVLALFSEDRWSRTLLLWGSFFLELLLLYLLLNWLPTLLVSAGSTHGQAAGAQIGFNLGGVLAALLMGYLLKGRLRHTSVIITLVAIPILMVALARAPADVGLVFAVVVLLGCAVIAGQAFLYAMAPVAYPTSIRGIGIGMTVAVGRLGAIVGPKLGGSLKAAGHGPSQLLMDLLPVVVAGSGCALILRWHLARESR